ncbi:MAG: helicase HerA domain-containing protein, partial [Candidatus Binatia bacterium]
LHTCATGLHHPVPVPRIPAYLDSILGSQDFYGGFAPRIGALHVRPVGVTGFPLESWPEILGFLNRLATDYRWSNRFIFLDPHTAERHLRSYRRNWFQKRLSLMGLVKESFNTGTQTFANQDAVAMARDADAAVAEASSNTVRFGYYTCVILVMNEDPAVADASARELAKQLQHHGFPARIEEANAVEAYLGSLPGHGWPNVRRPLVHTLNLADFLPLTSVWPGLETNPCPYYPVRSPALVYAATSGSTPFRLNLHVSDVGHTLVFGPTGSGKSTLLGLLMAQFFRYPKAQVFAFDKGHSSFILARGAGGDHYDFFSDLADEKDDLAFYPLSGVDRPNDRLWAEGWLESLLSLQGVVLNPGQRKA